ncbi:MAG: hypothetical protein RL582_882 [Bacteroidota bacterium]
MQVLQIRQLAIEVMQNNASVPLVNSLSFCLEEGKTTALVGESGSGKSLTALSILKLHQDKIICNGQILYTCNGQEFDLLKTNEKELQKIRGKEIAMIFQEPMSALNPLIRCGDQIAECLVKHLSMTQNQAKKRTIELLQKVEFDEPEMIYKRLPHQLSGGQQQRIMIAMAISCEPKVLIADEPTTALDIKVQEQILSLLKKIQLENKMAVLLITHDIGMVEQHADEILVMYKGEMVERGTTAEILLEPKHGYTKGLLACRPLFSSKGKRLPVLDDFYNREMSDASVKQEVIKEVVFSTPLIENKNVLEVNHVSIGYINESKSFFENSDVNKTVHDACFDVKSGEIMGLVGESGSGKSTLSKAILKLISLIEGSIKLDGKSISEYERKAFAKKMQVVFQDPYGSLHPRMTIGEAIMEPMMVHGLYDNLKMRTERKIELLEMVGLKADDSKKFPHQFSGGQRQRICISRSLALNPSFLIFDESVSALDLSIQSQILNLVMDLRTKLGFSGLFISHNLSVIHYISDRVLVLQKGKIVEQGNTEQVFSDPQHHYTKQLVDFSLRNGASG